MYMDYEFLLSFSIWKTFNPFIWFSFWKKYTGFLLFYVRVFFARFFRISIRTMLAIKLRSISAAIVCRFFFAFHIFLHLLW